MNSFSSHGLLIIWKPEYNLGIPIIDEQHRGIVTTINTLYFQMQHKHGESILKPVIAMINEYARLHFSLEEEFLKQINYPDFDNHCELHRSLLADQARVANESLVSHDPLKLMNFLKQWWIEHICEKDKAFKSYLT